jgi:Phage integrase family
MTAITAPCSTSRNRRRRFYSPPACFSSWLVFGVYLKNLEAFAVRSRGKPQMLLARAASERCPPTSPAGRASYAATPSRPIPQELCRPETYLWSGAVVEASVRAVGKEREIKPWVLYSFRHTFLTRLGQSGCDAWTLARIAGHSSIAISSRYVHPSEDAVSNAMSRLSGHNIGHSERTGDFSPVLELPQNVEKKGEAWCARRDSNSRPNAPEAFALSS